MSDKLMGKVWLWAARKRRSTGLDDAAARQRRRGQGAPTRWRRGASALPPRGLHAADREELADKFRVGQRLDTLSGTTPHHPIATTC